MQTAHHQASVEDATRPADVDTQQVPAYDDSGHYATKGDLDRLERRMVDGFREAKADRIQGFREAKADRIRGFREAKADRIQGFEEAKADRRKGFEEIKGMLQRRSEFRRSVIIAIISAAVGALLTAIFGGLFG